MFTVESAPTAFEDYLGAAFSNLDHLQVIDQMLDFYVAEQPTDADQTEGDGDMLLFQWGEDEDDGFYLSLTRQLIMEDGSGDRAIHHLIVKFHFEMTEESENIEFGNDWCSSPEELEDFRETLLHSPAYEACFSETPLSSDLRWEEV